MARVSAEPNAIPKSGPASHRLTEAACRPNPTGTGMTEALNVCNPYWMQYLVRPLCV